MLCLNQSLQHSDLGDVVQHPHKGQINFIVTVQVEAFVVACTDET